MSNKKDKIDLALQAYQTASAKRLAKIKKEEERWLAEEKILQDFDKEVRQLIITVFRPVMKKLLARLDKKMFKVKVRQLGYSGDTLEGYDIESTKERHVGFSVSCSMPDEKCLVRLTYFFATNEENEDCIFNHYKLKDVNEQLITDTFIRALQKIS